MLYLIRHADAVVGPIDEQRYLSSYGKNQVNALGVLFQKKQINKPNEVWHSTLLRAKQTAEGLCKKLAWNITILEKEDLKPEDDWATILKAIKSEDKDIAIVGHNPFLECFAASLLENKSIVFEKASCLVLEKVNGKSPTKWAVITQFSADSLNT